MMNTQQAYNAWSTQYDTNINKTRDMEAIALREILQGIAFESVLEVGCGTGKNTVWFADHATHITAIDLSEEMMALAKEKTKQHSHITFALADITKPWSFATQKYDLISFSLVLEHIEHLDAVFQKCAACINPNGYVYIGELHPFKQYSGSKARFDTEEGTQVVQCYNHHVSDFTNAASANGFSVVHIGEFFDENDRTQLPRLLSILFRYS